MYNIVQVTHPVLLATVHANINDVTLLFTNHELLKIHEKHELEKKNVESEVSDVKLLGLMERPISEI
jgi:hypothetical protein